MTNLLFKGPEQMFDRSQVFCGSLPCLGLSVQFLAESRTNLMLLNELENPLVQRLTQTFTVASLKEISSTPMQVLQKILIDTPSQHVECYFKRSYSSFKTIFVLFFNQIHSGDYICSIGFFNTQYFKTNVLAKQ